MGLRMRITRKKLLILIAILLALGTAYGLYEWLRPMTPGEVVVAFVDAESGGDAEEHRASAQYLVESVRETFAEYVRLYRTLNPDGDYVGYTSASDSALATVKVLPQLYGIRIDSESVKGDSAEVRGSRMWGRTVVHSSYGFRLIRSGGQWLISDERAGMPGEWDRWQSIEANMLTYIKNARACLKRNSTSTSGEPEPDEQ